MRIIATLIVSLFLCPLLFADQFNGYNERDWLRCSTGEFQNNISVTQTNTKLTFGQDTKALYVKNTGSTNEMYVDPRDGVALASDSNGGIKLNAGEDIELSSFQTRSVGLIASSGETTTAQVVACW